MNHFDDINLARLSAEDIETIRALERKLGDNICLVAVERRDVLYAVEAKMGPNLWQRVDAVYPEIEGLKAFFPNADDAQAAKAALKNLLTGGKLRLKEKKRPIRVRQVVRTRE